MAQTELWDDLERRLESMTSPASQSGLVFFNRVLDRMGTPADLPALHVAGTNGKGSTAACLDAMLRAEGYDTALFTSPHLSVFGERLRVNGATLPVWEWHEALDAVEKALAACPECRLGYFQITTAAAFWLCRKKRARACVIEVGIGGLLDPTNALARPLISVVTPLGMDHMRLLGNTIESIAANKFGIVKPRGRAIFCGSPASVVGQFDRACEEAGATGEVFSRTCSVEVASSTLDGNEFLLTTPRGRKKWFTRLPGLYQPANASLALRALELIDDELPVSDEAKRAGLASVTWPGRMEVFSRDPDLILDGAHNPHGAAALVGTLSRLYGADAPIGFVYASMADKNYMESLELYARAFPRARLYCAGMADFPRCEKAAVLAAKARVLPWGAEPEAHADPARALNAALGRGGPVVVCGSLYFIARMRELVKNLAL